jgi:tRNA threonylcarbamoyladenosine modification (KEOPS) complex Cgi121 subunit
VTVIVSKALKDISVALASAMPDAVLELRAFECQKVLITAELSATDVAAVRASLRVIRAEQAARRDRQVALVLKASGVKQGKVSKSLGTEPGDRKVVFPKGVIPKRGGS